jgi:hypothetical protein
MKCRTSGVLSVGQRALFAALGDLGGALGRRRGSGGLLGRRLGRGGGTPSRKPGQPSEHERHK